MASPRALALLSLALLGLACRASEPPRVDADPAWVAFTPEHWLPGPRGTAPTNTEARAALERRCGEFHVEEAHDWSTSQHASAWSSDAFTRAFAAGPRRFCRDYHAPEGEALEAVGVGCVTCHVEPGEARIWTAGDSLEPARPRGCALPIARSPAFAGTDACAACHEFPFPDAPLRREALLMQSTISEHRESSASTRACADCHMPPERGHAFPGAYDPAMLRRALRIDARREGDAIVITLHPADVGHAVPTGDLFRRLEVSLIEDDGEGRERVLAQRWLGRRFGPQRDGALTLTPELEDTRVGPAGRTLRFPVPARAGALRWRVVHQRVLHAGSDPRRVAIEGQVELASGSL